MHITIDDQTLLREIRDAFSNYFPYLKMEFYRSPHRIYLASPETDQLDPSYRVGDLGPDIKAGQLNILPEYRVADIEKEFLDRFHLSVQIFRQQQNGWEQTTGMDDFTLQQLSEFGRDSSDDKIISEYEQGFAEPEEKPERLL